MRKITNEAINAFNSRKNFKSGNTAVIVTDKRTILSLHNNEIAILDNITNVLTVSTCGWNTPTTKERLNGLNNVSIYTKKGQMYLNGEEWDGKTKQI
jgi:hypothetical protein